jgi:hypothetical protein
MTNSRESFLQRVRQAVADGNRAGAAPALESRGSVGYQGAGPDPVRCFQDALQAAGGRLHVVEDGAAAAACVVALVHERSARKILLARGRFLDQLDLARALRNHEVTLTDSLQPQSTRASFFAADIGITGVEYLVA